MPLINCEVELVFDWSANCVIIYTNVANQVPAFTITETNLYVPVVTLSTQDNEELLPQLRLSSNMIGDNETNFPHQLLLTNRQVANIRKAFANHSSADIKLSKTQLSKMIQSGGFLGRLLGSLLKMRLPLIKNLIKPLAESVLILLGLTAAASATDVVIHKKTLGSRNMTTLIMSNDEIGDIINIVKSLAGSGLLLKGVTETVQNEAKEQK